ncbi:MAG: RnfABCDGE type electron transport complex subunit B [Chloroflexota bacterium]
MATTIIMLAGATMLILGVVMAWVLGWANKTFHVQVDPRVEAAIAALPGANCGGCGYVGCNEYAEAVVAGHAPPDKCPVGGVSCATALANILGVDLKPSWPYRPAVHCGARFEERLGRMEYRGEPTCISANLVSGVQGCIYGCLGLSDCERVCPFDAIHVIDGLAVVDYDKCTGCGKCAEVCPRNIISMVPFKSERMLIIACSNKDPGKYVKAVCKVGCIGCRACERAAGDVFKVEENLSHINYDAYDPEKMDAARVAVQKCPMKRIVEIGKPSSKDIDATKEKEVPSIVQADFKTTVDKTEWHG